MSHSIFPLFALSLSLLAIGCTTEETDPDQTFRTTTIGCGQCSDSNSPQVDDFEVPELNEDGDANGDSVSLVGAITPGNVLVPLEAIGDELVAHTAGSDVMGLELIGYKLRVNTPNGLFDLLITAYEHYESWADGEADISAYGLRYASAEYPTGDGGSVCPGYPDDAAVVTVIGGETYDREHKVIAIQGDDDWFTLACEGQAAYKMKRLNYGPNQDFRAGTDPATPAERTATLKMITADYCGAGTSYTAQGTEVDWFDVGGTILPSVPPTGALLEALWTDTGAVCLDTPRLVTRTEVEEECDLPTCDEIDPDKYAIVWSTYI
ncbi:ADYC domain-containing protein [Nannocystis punicea]|uniref:ADYC domain-containing protein n=1 Tax=Nannocystis punicea TaxID=2995304 RepID=A0ABY7GXY4_9BACT|nr:ADYC domain-containing protein [Nannocystis poenicansa]WAS91772.1 ADYC domain-containing protein [Nannocystis poenicansa]